MKHTPSSPASFVVNTGKRAFLKQTGLAVAALAAVPMLAVTAAAKGKPGDTKKKPSGDAKKLIIAIVPVKKDETKKFRAAAKAVVKATRKEPGNVSYELLVNPEKKNSFYFIEHWKDQEAIEAHFAAEHFKEFGKVLTEVGDGKAIITIYDIAAVKKV